MKRPSEEAVIDWAVFWFFALLGLALVLAREGACVPSPLP